MMRPSLYTENLMRTHLLAAACLLNLTSTVFAGGAYIEQVGTAHTASVSQQGLGQVGAAIEQSGLSHEAHIEQRSNTGDMQVGIRQSGEGNYSNVLQGDAMLSANIEQAGHGNVAEVEQFWQAAGLSVLQIGDGNRARSVQVVGGGAFSVTAHVSITQDGFENQAELSRDLRRLLGLSHAASDTSFMLA